MKISVLGLGYVGSASAACLAARGHDVVGVDINEDKVRLIADGRSPVVEDQLEQLVADGVTAGRLTATTDLASAVTTTEISLVCVGTPSEPNGGLSTVYLERVSREIGLALRAASGRHTVVFRSTMLPGTCENLLIPLLMQHSQMRAGADFGVAVNPEFLREGSSVQDFHDPPKTVCGELDPASGDPVVALYAGLPGPVFRVPLRVAEMTKYVDNSFHALKVGFANEIGAICAALDLDSHEVMDIFLADRKLNVSPAYLRPGFAFGGSCLPKDLRGLLHRARQIDVSVPILEHVLPSNETHLRRAVALIESTGQRRVGILGLSFKSGTDDLRESPLVELAERLLGKGYELRIYDREVSLARLMGTNLDYVSTRLAHLGELLADSPEEVVRHAEVCVVGNTDSDVVKAVESCADGSDMTIVDLVRLPDAARRRDQKGYLGLGW